LGTYSALASRATYADAERLRSLQHRERGGPACGDAAHDSVHRIGRPPVEANVVPLMAAKRAERGGGAQTRPVHHSSCTYTHERVGRWSRL